MSHSTHKPARPAQPEGADPANPQGAVPPDPAIEVDEQTPDGGRPNSKAASVPAGRAGSGTWSGRGAGSRDRWFATR